MTDAADSSATTAAADDSSSMMPQWLDDNHIDPRWMKAKTGLTCSECVVTDISNETRRAAKTRDGATLRLTLITDDKTLGEQQQQQPKTLMIKQIPPQGQALAKQLGLAREAYFYQHLVRDDFVQDHLLPKIYYAAGDFDKGQKICIMQDLYNAIDSGILFGPGNPNNWKRDLPTLAARAADATTGVPPTSAHVATVTFQKIAHIHAAYWQRPDLLLGDDKSWLRGHAWLQAKGQDSWQASQDLITNGWKKYLEKEKHTTTTIEWDPTLRETIEKAVQGISWDAQLCRLNVKDSHWTLVHGDFWPGNVMWMIDNNSDDDSTSESPSSSTSPIRFIDWEMVGVGSGPQDLGQYIISNMDPAERRQCERQLIETYYKELMQCSEKDSPLLSFTWNECWSEYRLGGFERWIWFLVYFLSAEMYDWGQFCHNQMAAFQKDHGIKPDEVTQPRP